ncbi:MAG: SDR family NAD(P)-dependent oxidoreductase, partial [Bacteroidota bacterium]
MKAEDRSVAIIGMAGRFPKADRLDQFLRNLQTGLDCIGDMSLQRMQRTNVDPAGSHQQMGFLSAVDAFDHAFFKISKGEADRMDPRQRLLLETCYQALENSTYPISHFSGSRTATYIADVALDYYRLADQFDPALYTGNLSSAMAGKVARMFNLRSKAMMIDTACSSGLVALHQACRDIRYGESDMALVAGCDLVLFPPSVDSDVKMGIESSSARSKTFSAQADGTGAGEAAVAVLLKSYRQAKEDGDPIHAIIRGSAANQDANLSASLTAPDAVAQSEALVEAWTDAGIDPSELGLIECHGTGTKLGDPIEIEGINLAFEKMSAEPEDCHVSAVKSNLGHTNSVAGLVSLAKVVLSIKFQERYPSVHFDAPNPLLDLEKYHLTVTREWTPWKTSGPRIAGISSFGMIGTNCHLVLSEEPVDASTSTEKSTTQYFSFSAPDEEAIQRHRTVLLDYAKQSNQWDAKALSKSLLSNRNQFAHRLSWWASDQTSFAKQLEQAAVSTPSSPEADNCFLLLSHFSPSQVNHSQCFDWAAQEAQTTREQIDALHKTFSIAGEFFFRLGLYHFLKKSAMPLDKVLADGSGKTLLNYINGKYKNLEEALREAEQAEASADVESRMAKFLNSKQESDIHFIELGPVANISEAVQSHKSPEQKIFTASSAAKDDLQAYFAELFEAGFDMAWRELPWLMAQPSDLLCPSYVFKPTRCWLKEADASTKQVDQTDLAKNIFYKIGKSPIDLSNARDVLTDKNILLVGPDEQLLQQVAKELSDKNTQVASIWLSDQFEVQHPGERYRIDWRRSTDYNDVEQELYMDDVEVDTVISIFPANENPQTAIDQDLMPLIHLLKSWHLRLSRENIRWVNVSLVPAAALGQNELASMQTAVMKGAGAEYRKSLFKNVQLSEEAASNWFDLLNDALQASITERFLYRDASGWHCDELEQLPFATSAFNHPPKGHYLITGGAVGIGFELAKHLAEKGAAGLYLIGRTDAKAKTKKAEKVRANLAYLQTTFGIAVSYFSADVSDGERMAEISQELGTQVERLDYIFHLAGVKGSWEPLVRKDVDDFVNTLRPKVAGTLHLENQFEKFQPKKLVAFSSLNSIIPQSNSIDYAVANAFLDAWAAINPSTRLVINWPGWKEAGMVKGLEDDRDSLKALSNEEGLQALDTSLGMGCANVLVADLDLRDL